MWVNEKAVELLETALENVRTGVSHTVAIVEVFADGKVGYGHAPGNMFHQLNSGVSLLADLVAESDD